jgi:hypothetical protein
MLSYRIEMWDDDGCKPSPHIRDDRDSGADAFGLMAIAYEEDRLI